MKLHSLTEKIRYGDISAEEVDKRVRQWLEKKVDEWHSNPCNIDSLLELTDEQTPDPKELFKKIKHHVNEMEKLFEDNE